MKYTRLGTSGLLVSRMCFGVMTFTTDSFLYAGVSKTREAEASALVDQALDAGVNFFDTADIYSEGQSEELLGRILGPRRQDVVITTKVGIRTGTPLTQSGLSRRHIMWSVDQSLKRLATDWIDLYVAHREDPHTPLDETLRALDDLVRSGKVRYLGFSNWATWKVAAAMELQRANGWATFTHGQMYYSLLGRDVEREIVNMMECYGLGLTVWSPLAGGFLSGKYAPDALNDPSVGRIGEFDFLPFDKAPAFALVEKMRRIADTHDASVAQVALAWLLTRRHVSSLIIGATKPSQLADNLRAVDLRLSDDAIAELDAATELAPTYPDWYIKRIADPDAADAIRAASGA